MTEHKQIIENLAKLVAENKYDPLLQNQILQTIATADMQISEKVGTLRQWRKFLLDDVHVKQKMLDKVDYCLYRLKQ